MRIAILVAAVVLLSLAVAGTAQGWGIKYATGRTRRSRTGRPGPTRRAAWACLRPGRGLQRPDRGGEGAGGPELALGQYLDAGLYPQLPTKFWRLVAATDTRAYFASGRLEQGLFWLTVELAEGQWEVAGESTNAGRGQCATAASPCAGTWRRDRA